MYMNKTNISPLDKRNYSAKTFPNIKKPNIVGYFSVDKDRNYLHDGSNLKYLSIPMDEKIKFDLNLGYENVVRKPLSAKDEKIDHILKFLLESGKESNNAFPLDFVSFRGLLRLIMCSPYEQNDDWIILATKYEGRIYLCQKETEKKIQAVKAESNIQKKILSYGFKFEQYVLSDDPDKKTTDYNDPVIESEEFCCMYKTQLENMDLFYGAEVDGIVSNKLCELSSVNPNDLEFVEVKLKLEERAFNQKRNYLKYKLRNWWCQCFLVNIKRIFVGIRSENGIVFKISEVESKTIPQQCQEYWSPIVCTEFLVRFLKTVKSILNETNCPDTVYEFYWNPRTAKTVSYNILNGKNNLSFLPDWYTSKVNSLTSHEQ